MKVAVSIPDRIFEQAEQVARRRRVSRSRVYSEALEEFVKKYRDKSVREALDLVYAGKPSGTDPLLTELQAKALREQW